MRRIASLGLLLAMTGCGQFVGNPFAGFGGFIGETHTYARNPNTAGDSSNNVSRVLGQNPTPEPLTPEPGNIWPGPLPPEKTLEDLEKDPSALMQPGQELNLRGGVGSGVSPGYTQPGLTPAAPPPPVSMTTPSQAAPRSSTAITPSGNATINSSGSVQTYTAPSGQSGIVVPNGNGTSTLIGPDGTVQTVPTPK